MHGLETGFCRWGCCWADGLRQQELINLSFLDLHTWNLHFLKVIFAFFTNGDGNDEKTSFFLLAGVLLFFLAGALAILCTVLFGLFVYCLFQINIFPPN